MFAWVKRIFANKHSSIYEQLGGKDAVAKIVKIFYARIIVDHRVAGFFSDVDLDKQIQKQTIFLTVVLGGMDPPYPGKDLRAAHQHLLARGLTDTHFDVVVNHLRGALVEVGVSGRTVKQVVSIANGFRNDVLNR